MPGKKPPRTDSKLLAIIREYLSGLEGKPTNLEDLKQFVFSRDREYNQSNHIF